MKKIKTKKQCSVEAFGCSCGKCRKNDQTSITNIQKINQKNTSMSSQCPP